MSAKREKWHRRYLRREYKYAMIRWERIRPPRILFWQYRKWKRSRPVKPNWMH